MIRNPIAVLVISFCLLTASLASGQQKYWLSFTEKTCKHFDPTVFFDAKTLENRKLTGQPLTDWYDLPVDAAFIQQTSSIADSVGYSSRWLNGMAIYATDAEIQKIKALPFILKIEPMNIVSQPASLSTKKKKEEDTLNREEKPCEQIYGLQGEQMMYHHLTGKGMRIAVLDIGFKNADKHPAFEYLRGHHGILLTYDFIHKRENVYNFGDHGTAVLSCIAGKYHGYPMGLAPDAEFLLARTERESTEFKDEEDAWVAAAEWAEQHGAQIISCSLGYNYQRYFYADMNGHTSVVSRGAAAAAKKGILICSAAGNEGDNNWKFIITPADGDSVLAVGGYDRNTRYHVGFSSFGPSADNRIKPNITACGSAWVATPEKFAFEEGTSFSTPLIAGFAACVWQYMRGKTNMEVMHTIEGLGSLYPYYDYAHGYGIAQAGYLFKKHEYNDSAVKIFEKDKKLMVSFAPGYFEDSFKTENILKYKYLYVRIADKNGIVRHYSVIKVSQKEFELSSVTKYLFEDRFSDDGYDGSDPDDFEYPHDWTVTIFFDNCMGFYKY